MQILSIPMLIIGLNYSKSIREKIFEILLIVSKVDMKEMTIVALGMMLVLEPGD